MTTSFDIPHAYPTSDRLTVLAIHGSASSGGQWRSLCGALGDDVRVLAPDLPGYGAALSGSETIDRLSYLEAIMMQSRAPIHLVAHSFGAAVALKLANTLPNHVRSIAIYDPVCSMPKHSHPYHLPEDLAELWTTVRNLPKEPAMIRFLDFWAGDRTWESLDQTPRDRLMTEHASIMRDFTEMETGYWSVEHPTYDGPITMAVGALSPEAVTEARLHLTQTYPHARVRTMPGLGHMAPMTHAFQTDAFFQRAIARATCCA